MSEEVDAPVENTLKLIDGSQCYACYAIFAEVPGYEIGIRPLVEVHKDKTFLGFRIRAVPVEVEASDDEVDNIVGIETAKEATAKSIAAAFPGFPFSKKTSTRCSLVGGSFVNRGSSKMQEVIDYMEEASVVRKVVMALTDGLKGVPVLNDTLLPEFLWDGYMELLEPYMPKGQDTPVPDNVVVLFDQHAASNALQDHIKKVTPSEEDETSSSEPENSDITVTPAE